MRVSVRSLHQAVRPELIPQAAWVETAHRRALNLRLASGALLSLCAPERGNGPGALLVEAPWPLPWRVGERLAVTPGAILGPGLTVALAGAPDWAPRPSPGLGALPLVRAGWRRAAGELGFARGALAVALVGRWMMSESRGESELAQGRPGILPETRGESELAQGRPGILPETRGESELVQGRSGILPESRGGSELAQGRPGILPETRGGSELAQGRPGILPESRGESELARGRSGILPAGQGRTRWSEINPRLFVASQDEAESLSVKPGMLEAAHPALTDPLVALADAGITALSAGRWEVAVTQLVGLGPGLTPSGDDLLAGFLILAQRASWAPAEPLGQALRALPPGRTTPVSEALLRWALDGVANERALDWLDGLFRGAPPPLDPVLAIGATSGADWAAGALLALDLLLKERGS